jgi:iron complex outermembrane receptor protein
MQASLVICSALLKLSQLSRSAIVYLRGARRFRIHACIALVVLTGAPACSGQSPDFTQKSLEDLMNIEVTSVSKREQKTSQVAAAVFVISQDDIRHSGALNIPNLLRMVPGLDVAQIDASKWAISARGFNGQYSNKLLVMIDGRTVYSPLFAGVFWDSLNVPLD